MGLFDEILGGVVKVAGEVFGGDDSGKLRRADWARIELERETARRGAEEAASQAAAAASNLAATRLQQQNQATALAQEAARRAAQIVAPIAGPVAQMFIPPGPLGPPPTMVSNGMLMNGKMDQKETLKALISMVDMGQSDGSIRKLAREHRFTFKDFTRLTRDVPSMTEIWTALGGKWLDPAKHFERIVILDKINDALEGVRRKRRGMSLKTLIKAGKVARKVEKALKGLISPRRGSFARRARKAC